MPNNPNIAIGVRRSLPASILSANSFVDGLFGFKGRFVITQSCIQHRGLIRFPYPYLLRSFSAHP